MLNSILKLKSYKITQFLLIFVGVKLLLGIGFFIGWKSDSFTFLSPFNKPLTNADQTPIAGSVIQNSVNLEDAITTDAFQLTVFISIVCATLLCWTFILLIKSRHDKKQIESRYEALRNELEMGQKASSELHLTHQQLENTSGQLTGIFQGTTDLISAIDTNYRFISFNDSFAVSIEDLFETKIKPGMDVETVLEKAKDKFEEAKRLWDRALGGETFTASQEFTKSLGKTSYFEITYTPIENSVGEVVGASQICRDVTERTLTEEELKRERDFVSAIFSVNSSLIMVLDREGRIIRFNEACESTTNYKEEEIKGRILWNILVPTDQIKSIKNTFQNLQQNDFSKEYVSKLITKDEQIRHISWQISPITDETGSNEFLVATGIDITETIASEMAQKRMLEILENSSDLIRISDRHGQITYLNPAGRKMLGLEVDTDITKLKINQCHPHWANKLMMEFGFPTATKNGSWLGETAVKTTGNKDLPASQLILSHLNKAGEVDFFSTVVRDTSNQKNLEGDLEKARDSALESTRLMSRFLANVSHEIRTPMNGIIGLAELLQNTDLSDVQKDYIETIQYSGDTLLTIINDILDFSKLEAGKLEFVNEDFDLYTTVESTIELFTSPLNKKNLELCLLIDPKVPSKLCGDGGRIRQILVNLISNAIKFTEAGQVVVRIKSENLGDNPLLHFSVEDSGIGISKEDQEKLFNAFTQADSSIASRFGGTGLGLAISKQLVNLMNGEIGVKSNLNQGSTFWFTAQFEAQEDVVTGRIENKSLSKVQTLIVDKNDTKRNILVSQTKSWGMYSDETNSTAKALELMKRAASNGEPFEIVIAGKTIDDASGLSLAQAINNNSSLRKTRVVFMYPDNNRNIVEKAKLAGVEYFITSPIRQTELLNTLNYMLTDEGRLELHGNLVDTLDELIVSKQILEKNGASTMNTKIHKNARILIAEDNLVNQKVILNQVTGLGYEADLVENGREVLDALQLKDYSLILMDCQMPIMDGFDATTKIRESEKSTPNHIPIIAVTAHAIQGDREKCIDIGMDDYITKPTKQRVLGDTINLWLNRSIQKNSSDELTVKSAVLPKTKPSLSEQENIDLRLLELEENCGREIVLECINLFLEDTSEVIDELITSQERLNFAQLAIDAHKLKGSSANMGSSRMPKLCQKLIEFSNNEQAMSTQMLLKQINEEYDFLTSIYETKKQSLQEPEGELIALS